METAVLRDLTLLTADLRPVGASFDESHAERSLATLAVFDSNLRAVESAILFSHGILSHLAVVGPSGWGKSHVMGAAKEHIARLRGPRSCQMWSAGEFLTSQRANRSSSAPLLLDNVQDAAGSSRLRQQLRLLLERRVRAGWPTMLNFTESRLSRSTRSLLPTFHEWSVALVSEPSPVEKEAVVGRMATAEGLEISARLQRILARGVPGNGRTLLGAIKRLQLRDRVWTTSSDLLRACGVLEPFMGARSSWDLRDHVFEAAKRLDMPLEAAVFVMLRVAELCESDVARFFGLEPREAYSMALAADASLRADSGVKPRMDSFVEELAASLHP